MITSYPDLCHMQQWEPGNETSRLAVGHWETWRSREQRNYMTNYFFTVYDKRSPQKANDLPINYRNLLQLWLLCFSVPRTIVCWLADTSGLSGPLCILNMPTMESTSWSCPSVSQPVSLSVNKLLEIQQQIVRWFKLFTLIIVHVFLKVAEVVPFCAISYYWMLHLDSKIFAWERDCAWKWHPPQIMCNKKILNYCIAGNFQERKLSQILRLCDYLRKFSPWNLGAWHPLARQKRTIPESSLCKNHIFHQFAKVISLQSFLLYSM